MKHRVVFIAMLLLPAFSAPTHSAADREPQEVVISTVNSVIARVNAERELLEAHPEKIYEVINDLILPNFDFLNMSKWVLGRQWGKATAEQRAVFAEEFKTLLVRTYAKALLGFTNEKVVYLETITGSKPNIVMVKTEIRSNANPDSTPVNYTMHISGGDWKVVNVAFEGVSLVETYRKSFASEIRNNGLASLIQKLTDKNKKLMQSLVE